MQVQALIALLLPLAAASGWYTARRHYQRKFLEDHVHPLTQAYRRGLNYLLDDKTDKAIAAVGQILEQDDESLEVQIAFGNLFRRRGEVERAIEIHTRLRATVGLTESQRARADLSATKGMAKGNRLHYSSSSRDEAQTRRDRGSFLLRIG